MSGTLPPPNTNTTSSPDELYRWLYLLYRYTTSIAGGGAGPGFGTAGVTTPNRAIVAGSTRNLDFLNLATLSIDGDEIAATSAEINQLHNSNIERNTLEGIQNFHQGAFYSESVIGAEAADVINVQIDITDADRGISGRPYTLTLWLSDDPQGLNYTTTAPDTSVTATTGALYDLDGNKKVFQAITDANGRLGIDINNTTAATWYLAYGNGFNQFTITSAITFT